MAFFDCSIDFQADRTFDELETEICRRYLAGLRFIPADRRCAREFTLAEFTEYPLFNHDVNLIWGEHLGHFRMGVLKGVNEVWLPDPQTWAGWKSGSLQRCLGVLLRQIDGVRDIQINPNTAGPHLDMWQTKVPFNSRLTIQEVGALLAQKLFCGIRFVPRDGASMRDATAFETERDLLGHRITLRQIPEWGGHELAIEPSLGFLNLLTAEERATLRGIGIQPWVRAPFQNHPWVRPTFYDDDLLDGDPS